MNGRKPALLLSFSLLFSSLIVDSANARVFSWVDEHGVTHYGDKVPDKYRKQSNKVNLRGKVSTYSSARVPSTSYGKLSSKSAPKSNSAAVTNINDGQPKNTGSATTRHYTGSRHSNSSRHSNATRHASGSRHRSKSSNALLRGR